MKETITQSQIEDAVDTASSFITQERGTSLDGSFASTYMREKITSTAELAEQLLTETPHPSLPGLYVPLHSGTQQQFEESLHVLPGHIVLLPSAFVDRKDSAFYPAIVSEDSIAHNALRLHVLRQPYKKQLLGSSRTILSGAAQAETKGVGSHGRTANDGVEAEHFTALMTISSSEQSITNWANGYHVNHGWRSGKQTSVTSEMHRQIFEDEIPQTTITITKQDILNKRAAVYWHESLRGTDGKPEHGSTTDALIIIQALGFQALKEKRPRALDSIKTMIAS